MVMNLDHMILEKFNDLGIRLAITVAVDKISASRESGLFERDELVKVFTCFLQKSAPRMKSML